jgi:hypothetical protein
LSWILKIKPNIDSCGHDLSACYRKKGKIPFSKKPVTTKARTFRPMTEATGEAPFTGCISETHCGTFHRLYIGDTLWHLSQAVYRRQIVAQFTVCISETQCGTVHRLYIGDILLHRSQAVYRRYFVAPFTGCISEIFCCTIHRLYIGDTLFLSPKYHSLATYSNKHNDLISHFKILQRVSQGPFSEMSSFEVKNQISHRIYQTNGYEM